MHTEHYIHPVPRWKNRSTIAFLVVSNSFGNLLLAIGTKQLPGFRIEGILPYIGTLFTNPWILCGVVLLAFWMYAQLSMLSWSDLSYLVPMTASGYVLTALLGQFVLNESVSVLRWAGIGIITVGVFLVSDTAPRTIHDRERPPR